MPLPKLRLSSRRPRYADIAATLALIIASTGTAYAANTVGTIDIIDGAVTTPKLADAAVTAPKLAQNSIGSGKVSPNSLTLADIKGANLTGSISMALSANSCGNLNFSVTGAAAGQAALLTWTGTVPSHIVIGPLKVVDSGHITAVACNVSGTAFSGSGIGIRIVTFG